MTIENRLLVGTVVDGAQVVAVYDPFDDAIDIEVDGRLWSSCDPTTCRKYAVLAETFAIDLHFLLMDRYKFAHDRAFKMLQDCLINITTYSR